MTSEEILIANRTSLISYLETWGFACFDHENTGDLREAALLNYFTERVENEQTGNNTRRYG